MIKKVQIKNMILGEGMPKVCVPLVAKNEEGFLQATENLKGVNFDIVELRIDHFENVDNIEKVLELLRKVRGFLGDKPLLFTFRTLKEGGEKDITPADYVKLNGEVAKSGLVDMVDVELFTGDEWVVKMIEEAHSFGVKVIMSNHDFHKTPEKDEIVKRLCKMQDLGADVAKIALMPEEEEDVITVLEATLTMKKQFAKVPVVTMSMGGKGVISRIAGEIFGSALTFGAVGKASAPGQLEAEKLVTILNTLHDAI